MAKRPRWTAEEVVQNLSDDDDDLDDPDEPMMDSSDDEFTDLELDSDYDDGDMMDIDNPGSQLSFSPDRPNSPVLDPNSVNSYSDSIPPPSPSTSPSVNG